MCLQTESLMVKSSHSHDTIAALSPVSVLNSLTRTRYQLSEFVKDWTRRSRF